jgi:hypothetical protein
MQKTVLTVLIYIALSSSLSADWSVITNASGENAVFSESVYASNNKDFSTYMNGYGSLFFRVLTPFATEHIAKRCKDGASKTLTVNGQKIKVMTMCNEDQMSYIPISDEATKFIVGELEDNNGIVIYGTGFGELYYSAKGYIRATQTEKVKPPT